MAKKKIVKTQVQKIARKKAKKQPAKKKAKKATATTKRKLKVIAEASTPHSDSQSFFETFEVVHVSGTPESLILSPLKGQQDASREEIISQETVSSSVPDEFKEEAVQLLLDGYTAPQVVDRLGISNVNVLYRWKQE